MGFSGGSAWAMARDISAGHLAITERTFRRMQPAEIDKLKFEMNRMLNSVRGDQPALDDFDAVRIRNRRIQRLMGAMRMLNFHLLERRR